MPRVWATIRPYNATSLHLAGKLGFAERHNENDERGPLNFLAREASGSPAGHGSQDGRPSVAI